MQLSSLSFSDRESISDRYAFARIDPPSHVTLADNFNPQFSWDEVPDGTESFVLICHDPDAPSRPDDVNQEGRPVRADLPRTDFVHWVLIDLDKNVREIEEGEFSSGVTPRGKGGPLTPKTARQGLNDYTSWFASDHDMRGEYFGYDGPCPPWNDERVHRYVFTLYALSVPQLEISGTFDAAKARAAMKGNILAQASVTGTYTLNPDLAPKVIGPSSA